MICWYLAVEYYLANGVQVSGRPIVSRQLKKLICIDGDVHPRVLISKVLWETIKYGK